MNKQELIKRLNGYIKHAQNEPFDSHEETEGFIGAMEIALDFASRLDELPTEPREFYRQYCQDRIDALSSLDEAKLRAYYAKYGIVVSDDGNVFWIGVHKEITGLRMMPFELRQRSAMWLSVRGYSDYLRGE